MNMQNFIKPLTQIICMTIKKGDFIEMDFIGKIKETNDIFDLTNEKEAKANNLFNPKAKYGPRKYASVKVMLLKV